MKLVIDSNRVMAGLIKDSITRMIILNDDFQFIAPEFLLTEIEKYRDYLMKKAHQTEREFDLTLSTLMGRIDFIPEEEFFDSMEEAEKIMKEIDPKDSPFLAVGIAVNAMGIWSEDTDFDGQAIMKRYSTSDLYSIILP